MARDDEMMTPDDNGSNELVPAWTTDGHVDEGTIHAWLDGAFDDAATAVVGAHVDGCAVCRESVAEARGFIAGASRMVRALDAVPSGVVPQSDVERAASRIVAAAAAAPADATSVVPIPVRAVRPWYTRSAVRSAAAILVVVAGGGYLWSRDPDAAFMEQVDRAVDSSLAPSSLPAAAPVAPPVAAPVAVAASVARERADQPIVERTEKRVVSAPARKAAPPAAREAAPTVVAAADAMLADSARANFMKIDTAKRAAMSVAQAPAPPAAPSRWMLDTAPRIVSGRVMTASGAPAVGVRLFAVGPKTAEGTTDSSGAYRLRVTGDSIVLNARQLGYAPTSRIVDLRNRDSARVDLRMEPSVLTLQSVVIAPSVAASERTSSGAAAGGRAVAGGVARPVIASGCWLVRPNTSPTLTLPTYLMVPAVLGEGSTQAQWINWPVSGRTTSVYMSMNAGSLSGTGASEGDSLTITLTQRGSGWAGVAVHRRGATRAEQTFVLTSASVCKM